MKSYINTDKVIAYNLKYTHTKYEIIIPLNKVRTKLLNIF